MNGGWSVNDWDDLGGQVMDEFVAIPFNLLLGRKTYESFAAHWPHARDESGAAPVNNDTKYVVTTTPERVDWLNSHRVKGEVVARLRNLKRQDGHEIQVHGSASLTQTPINYDLVDRFRLWIFPPPSGSPSTPTSSAA